MFFNNLKQVVGEAFVASLGFATFLITLTLVSTASYLLGVIVFKAIGIIT